MDAFTPKRPAFWVQKFYGIGAVDEICDLADTHEYSITQGSDTPTVMQIAGLTLKIHDLLVKAPDGSLSIMSAMELYKNFEALK